jgi:WD40 repeat protein
MVCSDLDSLSLTSSHSDLLFAGLDNGRICCWLAGSRNLPLGFLELTDCHPSCVNALAVIGCALIAGYESGDMAVWRLGPRDAFEEIQLWACQDFHTDGIRAFANCLSPSFSFDSSVDPRPSALLISASADQQLCFWNATDCMESLSSSSRPPLLLLHTDLEAMSINAIAVEWCREGHGDGVSGQPPGHWDRRKVSHWLRVFSASGSGSWDRIIRVFTSDEDGTNIRQTGSLRGHEQPIDSLVIVKSYGCEGRDAEGRERETCRLVSCSSDSTVRLWDTRTNTQVPPPPLPSLRLIPPSFPLSRSSASQSASRSSVSCSPATSSSVSVWSPTISSSSS